MTSRMIFATSAAKASDGVTVTGLPATRDEKRASAAPAGALPFRFEPPWACQDSAGREEATRVGAPAARRRVVRFRGHCWGLATPSTTSLLPLLVKAIETFFPASIVSRTACSS